MSRTRHKIPDNLNPDGDICVPIFVPNDTEWISIFHRAIRTLTFDRHWERDEVGGNDVLAVRKRWEESTYYPLIDTLLNSTPCSEDTLGACFRMDAATEAFSFYPNDPFISDTGETIVLGMTWRRWEDTDAENSEIFQAIEDILSFLTGYYPNDCMIFPSNLIDFAFSNILDLINYVTLQVFPFPYVHVDLQGSGQFEIELVNVPFGGSAWIIPDVDITSWQDILSTIIDFIDNDGELPETWIVTEVDRDFSVPPEVAPTQTQEIEFQESGEHSVTIVFVPRLDDELPFLFPLGGIREIEVCGNLQVIGSQSGNTYDKLNAGASAASRQGVIPVTTSEELCQAVECGIINVFQRAISGQAGNVIGNVTINSDGTVTVDSGTGTKTQSQQEALTGSVRQMRFGLNEYLLDYQEFWSTYSADRATPKSFLKAKWQVDETKLDAAYDAYADYRDGAGAILAQFTDDLDAELFCEGATRQTVNEHIIDDVATNKTLTIQMCDALLNEQFAEWYDTGALSPRDDYIDYPCYISQPVVIPFNTQEMTDNITKTILNVNTPNTARAWKIRVTGTMTTDDGDEYDGLYLTLANNTVTQRLINVNSGGSTLFDDNKPAYKQFNFGSNGYEYSAHSTGAGANLAAFPNSTVQGLVWTSGTITYTFIDLGVQ